MPPLEFRPSRKRRRTSRSRIARRCRSPRPGRAQVPRRAAAGGSSEIALRLTGSEGVVGSVAERLLACRLAAAEPQFFGFRRDVGNRAERGALVRAVAEGLGI